MADASEWLVEIDAFDGTNVVTLRYSSGGYTTGPGDLPANVTFDARIAGLSPFGHSLFVDGRTTGQASVEPGAIVLSNADRGIDHIKNYAFDGRAFRVFRLPNNRAPFSDAVVMLVGTMDRIDAGEGSLTLRIPFYDRRRDLDLPIQEERYAGTTVTAGPTAEGSADLKDRVKPLCFGRCYSVPAIIVNDFNMFLQFSASPLTSITLYDGGVPLINDGNVATIAQLAAATGNPGHYRTCLALGLARPFGTRSGRPEYIWTADIIEGATATNRRAASIVQRMLARIGITDIDAASFSALNSLSTAELQMYIDSETTVLAAVYEILRSIGGFIIPDAMGRFHVGRLDAPGTPVRTLTEYDILTSSPTETLSFISNPDTDGAVPTYSVLTRWGRNWHVFSDADVGGCVNVGDPTRATGLKLEWREVSEDDPSVQARHLLSRQLEVDTLMVEQADAQAEASRELALYGVNRDVVRIGVEMAGADDLVANATVVLMLDRFDYEAGKAMVIIGRSDDFAAEKTVLTLWG